MTENEEIVGFNLAVVPECPLVPQTRCDDGSRVRVEWVGRCWAILDSNQGPLACKASALTSLRPTSARNPTPTDILSFSLV